MPMPAAMPVAILSAIGVFLDSLLFFPASLHTPFLKVQRDMIKDRMGRQMAMMRPWKRPMENLVLYDPVCATNETEVVG